jgi:hypothetical protein
MMNYWQYICSASESNLLLFVKLPILQCYIKHSFSYLFAEISLGGIFVVQLPSYVLLPKSHGQQP